MYSKDGQTYEGSKSWYVSKLRDSGNVTNSYFVTAQLLRILQDKVEPQSTFLANHVSLSWLVVVVARSHRDQRKFWLHGKKKLLCVKHHELINLKEIKLLTGNSFWVKKSFTKTCFDLGKVCIDVTVILSELGLLPEI